MNYYLPDGYIPSRRRKHARIAEERKACGHVCLSPRTIVEMALIESVCDTTGGLVKHDRACGVEPVKPVSGSLRKVRVSRLACDRGQAIHDEHGRLYVIAVDMRQVETRLDHLRKHRIGAVHSQAAQILPIQRDRSVRQNTFLNVGPQ